MKDPYQILGVARDSSQNEIKKAFRKLAKELHPDRNPDNRQLAERFKEVSAAYQILGDPKDRARYDRGEIDASGNERHPGSRPGSHGGGHGGEAGRGAGRGAGPEGFDFSTQQGGFEDLFGELFGNFRRSSRQGPRIRGADRRYSITVGFLDAVHGGKRRVALSGGKTLEVNIPSGIVDGQHIRLKGQGEPGIGGGPAGDALVEVKIEPHAFFVRDGLDIHVELPITLSEAVMGGRINAPTVDGMVNVTVPKGANTGTRLRLKAKGIKHGKGASRGDQIIKLKVVLPDAPDSQLVAFVEKWRPKGDDNVREKFRLT
jgi:DnaJ-class molecular chaperone